MTTSTWLVLMGSAWVVNTVVVVLQYPGVRAMPEAAARVPGRGRPARAAARIFLDHMKAREGVPS